MTGRTRDEAQHIVTHLSEQIGVRKATSPEEAAAAAYVNAQMRRIGLKVSLFSHQATPHPNLTYPILATLLIFAGFSALLAPLPAFLLAVTVSLMLLVDAMINPLPRLGSHRPSQTIVGNRAVEGDGIAPGRPHRRVIILAPLDTPVRRRGLVWLGGASRIAALTRLLIGISVAIGTGIAVQRAGVLMPVLMIILGPILLLIGSLLPAPSDSHHTGTGALTTLINATQRLTGLNQIELWAVAIGASSVDASGFSELLRRYPFEPESTFVIAIDQIGAGHLVYTTREGALQTYRADPLLVELADAADAADTTIDADPRANPTNAVLAAPAYRQSYRTISIRTLAPPNGDSIDLQTIERTVRLVTGIVRGLEGAAPGQAPADPVQTKDQLWSQAS
jgi:hypothetical protein